MKFLKTEVWRLNAPVFLSAHDRISSFLSIVDGVIARDLVKVVWVSCGFSRARRAVDLSMWQ